MLRCTSTVADGGISKQNRKVFSARNARMAVFHQGSTKESTTSGRYAHRGELKTKIKLEMRA